VREAFRFLRLGDGRIVVDFTNATHPNLKKLLRNDIPQLICLGCRIVRCDACDWYEAKSHKNQHPSLQKRVIERLHIITRRESPQMSETMAS